MSKRLYDVVLSLLGLMAVGPLIGLVAVWVKLWDGGPAFFRQVRIGRHGRPFRIVKFRTMTVGSEKCGRAVTAGGDGRVTGPGRLLRKTKVDELPQLINVVRGEMSLVGPRPEVPEYVRRDWPEQRLVLQARPGMTDLASLVFRDEEQLLAKSGNVERCYVEWCLPKKLELALRYARMANVWRDTEIILATIFPPLSRRIGWIAAIRQEVQDGLPTDDAKIEADYSKTNL